MAESEPEGRDELVTVAERPYPRVAEILAADEHPPPPQMLIESSVDLGAATFQRARYVDDAWHRAELDNMWSRVWQMACHTTQIPDVGSYILYEIGDESLLVVRTAPDEIRAFHNSCLHRGNCLRRDDGSATEFTCGFHGWSWRLDGSFAGGPCEWDVPGLDATTLSLPEASVALWAGWVFVNLADDPEPFESYCENLDELADGFHMADKAITQHMQKVVPGNWKTCMEAFIEAYHVTMAHPEIVTFSGDYLTQYDIYPDVRHVSRMIVPYGVPSPSVTGPVDAVEVVRFVMGDDAPTELDGASVRKVVADHKRRVYGELGGADLSDRSDSDMLDAIELFLFPNFVPWLGVGQPYVYRFRPNGHDPDTSIMDVYTMRPIRPGSAPERAPETIHIGIDAGWAETPGVGTIGAVLDQDMPNVAGVQRGLKAGRTPDVRLTTYQESRILHFHRTLDAYVEG